MSFGDSICEEVVIRKDYAAHQHECLLRPVTCPNGCGCIMSVKDEKSHSCITYLSQTLTREVTSLRVENTSLQESVLSLKGENTTMKEEYIALRQELDDDEEETNRLTEEMDKQEAEIITLRTEVERQNKEINRLKIRPHFIEGEAHLAAGRHMQAISAFEAGLVIDGSDFDCLAGIQIARSQEQARQEQERQERAWIVRE